MLPILSGCVLTDKGLAVSSLDSVATFNGIKPDSEADIPYPNYQQVLPNEKTVFKYRIAIGVAVLETLLKIAKETSERHIDGQGLLFEFTEPTMIFKVTVDNGKDETLAMHAMPMIVEL